MNKKRCFIICATLLMVILLSNIFGYSTTNIKPTYAVTTENVNLRYNVALSSASKVKTVSKNTSVKVLGTIGNFNIVQLGNNQVGLISKDYIKSSDKAPSGAKTYENLAKYYAFVNGDNVALRGGPSTSFKAYKRLEKGTKLEVIGKIDDFLMVVTKNNDVGMIRKDLLISEDNANSNNTNNSNNTSNTNESDIEKILRLINEERKKDGKPLLTLDQTLTKAAQTKSDDMVKNNYFSHTSPTYGSPFKLIQDFGISYKVAGENIAGNPSIEDAIASFMKSESHKKNILSNAYNYVGIGVTKSKTYGNVIVLMFIGK